MYGHEVQTADYSEYLAVVNDSFSVVVNDVGWKVRRHPLTRKIFDSQVKATGRHLQ